MEQNAQDQIKVAQQHLANERTFLAWIRTSISIIGIGFLATSLHFTIGKYREPSIDFVAILIGLFSCIISILTTVFAILSYRAKKEQIHNGIFMPANMLITTVAILLIALIGIVIIYFLILGAFNQF